MNNIFPHNTEKSIANMLPEYVTDDKVKLIRAEEDGLLFTPDWFSSLILVEIHPETATREGTLEAMIPVLDHLAAMGINGVWITPVYKKGPYGNGYSNFGLHTLESAVTGVEDVTEGWAKVKEFVDEAHKRNIRVFLDIITWGVENAAPLITEYPDWFSGTEWGGAAFDWNNDEFRAWFIDNAINNILASGADGYRCDCEPMYSGYRVFAEVRTRLLALGKKIAIIAEESSERRGTYDCEQDGMTLWIDWSRYSQYTGESKKYFINDYDIVDAVRNGTAHGDKIAQEQNRAGRNQYYTYCISNHDFTHSFVNKNRLIMGYQAIFAPFIPLWYLGGEFGMKSEGQVIYFVPVDWSLLDDEDNRKFCADITEYIKIRRTYPKIFNYFPLDHRNSNIAPLEADTALRSYARFADGKAIFVIPRNTEEADEFTVSATLSDVGISGEKKLCLTNLLTNERTDFTLSDGKVTFKASVAEKEHLALYILE